MTVFKTSAVVLVGLAAAFSALATLSPAAKQTTKSALPTRASSISGDDKFTTDSLLPKDAAGQDRASMQTWFTQNELCRGSSDAATIDAMCPKRDHTENALRARGWCWAYEDDSVFPTDYRWHRCSERSLSFDQRSIQPDNLAPGANGATTLIANGEEAPNSPLSASPNSQPQQLRMDDARAMVRESWDSYGQSIKSIEIGSKCGVVDELSANVAIQNVQVSMQRELASAGLLGDQTMSLEQISANYVRAGKVAVQDGACARMTPAMRGRLRSMVSVLMR